MILSSLLPGIEHYDVKILATDIDTQALTRAHRGEYSADRVMSIPENLRTKYFEEDKLSGGKTFRAADSLKDMISFRKLNLNGPAWPMKGMFDVIFCRNTLIYFDDATQAKILDRFSRKLHSEGFLYLGHSERLSAKAKTQFGRVATTTFQLTK